MSTSLVDRDLKRCIPLDGITIRAGRANRIGEAEIDLRAAPTHQRGVGNRRVRRRHGARPKKERGHL